jgi:hypothetical protein
MRKTLLTACLSTVLAVTALSGTSIVSSPCFADSATLYSVNNAITLTDFSKDLPADEKNVSITLILPDAVKPNVAVVTTLIMKDGVWQEKNAAGVSGLFPPLQSDYGPPAPPQKGTASAGTLALTADGLKGTFTIALTSMEWRKKRVHIDGTWEVTLDLKLPGAGIEPARGLLPTGF